MFTHAPRNISLFVICGFLNPIQFATIEFNLTSSNRVGMCGHPNLPTTSTHWSITQTDLFPADAIPTTTCLATRHKLASLTRRTPHRNKTVLPEDNGVLRQDPLPAPPISPPPPPNQSNANTPPSQPHVVIQPESLEQRLDRLESRIDALERIIFATAKISAIEAERRLQDAEAQRRESRQLFLKGIVAESRWRQDEFMVELLRRERDLLLDTAQQRKQVMAMELLQAENNLRVAEDQLHYLKNLANRGFATIDQVRENERYVAESKARLTLAREKLQAAEELDAITNNRTPPPPQPTPPANPQNPSNDDGASKSGGNKNETLLQKSNDTADK